MIGRHKGFAGLLKNEYPDISVNHCMIHHEALASKDLSESLNIVMSTVIKVINFIKARDLNSRLFKQLCAQEDSDYDPLLLNTAVRWLSRGKALQRVFILRDEISQFLSQCPGWSTEADLFADSSFLLRLAFLDDIFDLLIKLNIEMQG